MILEELYIEIVSDILLIIIVVAILTYALKREELRQNHADEKYEQLLIKVTDTTSKYADTLVNVIEDLPNRQRQMIEEVSKQHLQSTRLIVEELKIITTKLDRSYELKDEFVEYIKEKERIECEKRHNNK